MPPAGRGRHTRVSSLGEDGGVERFTSGAFYVTGPYRFTELDGASHWLPEQAAGQVAALLAEHFAAAP